MLNNQHLLVTLSQLCVGITVIGTIVLLFFVFVPDWRHAGLGGIALFVYWGIGTLAVAVIAILGSLFEYLAYRKKYISYISKKVIISHLLAVLIAGISLPGWMGIQKLQKAKQDRTIIQSAQDDKPATLFAAAMVLIKDDRDRTDKMEGLKLLKNAAEQDYGRAQIFLAKLYYNGRKGLVEKDEKQARIYLAMAQRNNDKIVIQELKSIKVNQQWFTQAHKSKNTSDSRTQCSLGSAYAHGLDFVTQPDFFKAARWMQYAIDNGDRDCRSRLSNLFLRHPGAWWQFDIGATKEQVLRILGRPQQHKRGAAHHQSEDSFERGYWQIIRARKDKFEPSFPYEVWTYIHERNIYHVIFHGQTEQKHEQWTVYGKQRKFRLPGDKEPVS